MRIGRSIFTILVAIFLALLVVSFILHRAMQANAHAAAPAKSSVAHASLAASQTQARDGETPFLYFAEDPEAVPPFLTHDLRGAVVSTAALKGKVVLINFWATWCGPCRQEIPELINLQSQYKDQLQIVGISEDEAPPAQVANFIQKAGINYPVVMGSEALEKEYGGVAALPTSFLVNKDGRVVAKDVGLYTFDYYNLQVRALMGLPVDAHIETFKDTGQIFLKNASRASELPGVSFVGLTAAQKKMALRRLNAESCTCGCQLTLAECRINDTTCPVSTGIANKIVQSIARSGAAAAPSASKSSSIQ